MLNTHAILRLLQRIRRLTFILSTAISRKLIPFHWWHSLLVTLRALRGIDRTDSNPKPPSVSCADSALDLHASAPSILTARLQNVIGSNPEAPRDEVISFSSIPGVAKQTSAFSGEPGEDVTTSARGQSYRYSMTAEITGLVAITTKEEYERYERNKP